MFELGEFTHNNFVVSQSINSVDLDLSLSVMINGYYATIKHTINFDHNETSNSGPDPRDIVTISNASTIVPVEIVNEDGVTETYNFQIIGFVDENGDIVNQVFTNENASNSYKLLAKLVSSDAPEVTGQIEYAFGADGPADEEAVVWNGGNGVTTKVNGDIEVQGKFGVLTVSEDGSYTYQLDQVAYDGLDAGQKETESFTYTLTDGDGDSVDSTLDITITGEAAPQNPDPMPAAEGGAIEGYEDSTAGLAIAWGSLNVSDNTDAIRVVGTAGNGQLKLDGQDVANGQEVSKADVEAGKLVFVPAVNESGFNEYGGDGVGDQQADYSHIAFKPMAGDKVGSEATLAVDIIPMADAPTVSASLGEVVESVREAVITVEHGDVSITIDGTDISATGMSGDVIKPPFTDGNLNPGSQNNTAGADIIALIGDFNKLVNNSQSVNSINGHDQDYVYLSKPLDSYEVSFGDYHNNSGYDGSIKDLDSGVTISANNIRGLIFGDGSTVLPPDAVTTITQTGYDDIEYE